MKKSEFSISKRLKSFVFAFNGLKILINEEPNARIHLFSAGIVILASLYFGLTSYEWIAIVFSIGLVLTAEILNTSIENIADFLTMENNSKIKIIKDLSAAAVLISAITALTIAIIIFLPKIFG